MMAQHSLYRWRSKKERDRRDAAIREAWELGEDRHVLAERFDLTDQRIWQIATRYLTPAQYVARSRRRK